MIKDLQNGTNKKGHLIAIEGIDGVGKSTQCDLLSKHLSNSTIVSNLNSKTLSSIPLMRNLVLNNQYSKEITPLARELLTQAMRSIHFQHELLPALNKFDVVVSDRGPLSGIAYAVALDHSEEMISALLEMHMGKDIYSLYDDVIILYSDRNTLDNISNREKEFSAGDAIESLGSDFMRNVQDNLVKYSQRFNSHLINVDGKTPLEITHEILGVTNLVK